MICKSLYDISRYYAYGMQGRMQHMNRVSPVSHIVTFTLFGRESAPVASITFTLKSTPIVLCMLSLK